MIRYSEQHLPNILERVVISYSLNFIANSYQEFIEFSASTNIVA